MTYRLIILFTGLIIWISPDILAQDSHEGHDHAQEQVIEEVPDEHAGHDHAINDDSQKNSSKFADEELSIELTPEAIKLADIKLSKIKLGSIDRTIEFPGEVGFNEDRVAHISPRFAGIAQQAKFRVGEYVNKGQIMATVESNESLNTYSIKAPISGWVIERHITTGEFVSQENSVYIIADLSTVWVNLAVYPKDVNYIKKNQSVIINAVGTNNETTGTIEYITPVMDFRTRSLTARITLPNKNNSWRPGSFVKATINIENGGNGLLVEKNAVQFLHEMSVIFVADGTNKFTPVEVTTGDSNRTYIQILNKLSPETKYVSSGAFELKAKIVTSNLDAHAGHGR